MRHTLLLLILALLPLSAQSAELILNEYNAVEDGGWLNGGTATLDQDGGFADDSALGRVISNGGDWFELVVIADHLDIRGWKLEVCDAGVCGAPLVLSQDPLWSDLRAGTLITVSAEQTEDASYDPGGGDWWINVRAATGGTGTYITASPFTVSHTDWQLTILDDADHVIFGPAGETISGAGVNRREVLKLEGPPSAMTRPNDVAYDDGIWSSFGAPNRWGGGVAVQHLDVLRLGLPFPDSDGDGIPDDGDQSGVIGDAPCDEFTTAGCDDNCTVEWNPLQLDRAGIGSTLPDGDGDACQCGDVTNDGQVQINDATIIKRANLGLGPGLAAADKCNVIGATDALDPDGDGLPGDCLINDATVVKRAILGLGPGIAPVCEAAVVPEDISDLLFDRERVLEIDIWMDPNDWDALRFDARSVWDELGPGCFDGPHVSPYTFFPADITIDGQTLTGVGVRKKGFFGSADFVKPALKVDFGEFNPGQEYLGMDRLTLNNAKQDPALIKQCLGYQLFTAAGLPASRCNFAHVTVNGQDLGVYVNVESIKKRFLARYFADNRGNLYEGAVSDFRVPWVNTFEKKTNESDPDRSDLQAIVDALELPDAQLEAALAPLIDLDAFFGFWAMEALIGHWDSYHNNRNNFWIYFDPTSGQAHFLPWGIDAIFAGGSPFTGETQHRVVSPRSQLTRRLYLNLATQPLYLDRVNLLLATVWNEAGLLAEIDRMEALLAPYSGDISAAVQAVRDFVNTRRGQVEAEIGGGPPPWTELLGAAICLSQIGGVNGSFNTTWDTLDQFPFNTGWLDMTLHGSPVPISLGVAVAGVEVAAGGRQDAVVRVMGTDFVKLTGVNLIFPPELVKPGTVDLSSFLIAIFECPWPGCGSITLPGWLVDGTATFTQADTVPGAPIVGTFSGRIGGWVP